MSEYDRKPKTSIALSDGQKRLAKKVSGSGNMKTRWKLFKIKRNIMKVGQDSRI